MSDTKKPSMFEPPAWFGGESWCPATDEGTRVDAPVGKQCYACLTPILDGEDGYLRPYLRTDGTEMLPIHKECDLRGILGGLDHLQRTCRCYGGTSPRAKEMTHREEAIAVWRYWQQGWVKDV